MMQFPPFSLPPSADAADPALHSPLGATTAAIAAAHEQQHAYPDWISMPPAQTGIPASFMGHAYTTPLADHLYLYPPPPAPPPHPLNMQPLTFQPTQAPFNFYPYPMPPVAQPPQMQIPHEAQPFFTPPTPKQDTHIIGPPAMYHAAHQSQYTPQHPHIFDAPATDLYPDAAAPIVRRPPVSYPLPHVPAPAPRAFRPSRLRNVSNFDDDPLPPPMRPDEGGPLVFREQRLHDIQTMPQQPLRSESLAYALTSPVDAKSEKRLPVVSPIVAHRPQLEPPPQRTQPPPVELEQPAVSPVAASVTECTVTHTPAPARSPSEPESTDNKQPLAASPTPVRSEQTSPSDESTAATTVPASSPPTVGVAANTTVVVAPNRMPGTEAAAQPAMHSAVLLIAQKSAASKVTPNMFAKLDSLVQAAANTLPIGPIAPLSALPTRGRGKRKRGCFSAATSRAASPAFSMRAIARSRPGSRAASVAPESPPKRFAPSGISFHTGLIASDDAVDAMALAHRYRTRSKLKSIHDEPDEKARERDLFLIRGGVFEEVTNGKKEKDATRDKEAADRWMLTRARGRKETADASAPASRAGSVAAATRPRTGTPARTGGAAPVSANGSSPTKITITLPARNGTTPSRTPAGTPAPGARASSPPPASTPAPAPTASARPTRALPQRAARAGQQNRAESEGSTLTELSSSPASSVSAPRQRAPKKSPAKAAPLDGEKRRAGRPKRVLGPPEGLPPTGEEHAPTTRRRSGKQAPPESPATLDAAASEEADTEGNRVARQHTGSGRMRTRPEKKVFEADDDVFDETADVGKGKRSERAVPTSPATEKAGRPSLPRLKRKRAPLIDDYVDDEDESDEEMPPPRKTRRTAPSDLWTPSTSDKGKERAAPSLKRQRENDDDGAHESDGDGERAARRHPRRGHAMPAFSNSSLAAPAQAQASSSATTLDTPATGVRDANGWFTMRTFAPHLPKREDFSLWYRRFPLPGVWKPWDPVGDFVLGTQSRAKPPSGGQYNNPTSAYDLYTPRFVKGSGREKQGVCPICYEPVSRGGDGHQQWFAMKVSAYNYHMQNAHGISASSKLPFSPPVEFHSVKRAVGGKHEKDALLEGKCHQCHKWIPLEGIKMGDIKVKEIYWWKHAAKCHMGTLLGERDVYFEDTLLARLKLYEATQPAEGAGVAAGYPPGPPDAPLQPKTEAQEHVPYISPSTQAQQQAYQAQSVFHAPAAGFQPALFHSHAQPAGFHAQPDGFHGQSSSFLSQTQAFHSQASVFQPHASRFSPQASTSHAQPSAFLSSPSNHAATGSTQSAGQFHATGSAFHPATPSFASASHAESQSLHFMEVAESPIRPSASEAGGGVLVDADGTRAPLARSPAFRRLTGRVPSPAAGVAADSEDDAPGSPESCA